MKRRIFLFILSLALLFVHGHSAPVAAYSTCREILDLCEIIGESDAIFVGKVVGGKKKTTTDEDGVKQVWTVGEIYFEVSQAFVGVKKGARVTIRSGDENGNNGMWFKPDETYLVFAHGDVKKGFVTGHCMRTNLVSDAARDLEALKNLPPKGSGSVIAGTILMYAKSSLEHGDILPMRDLKVEIRRLDGKQELFEAITTEDGIYEVKNVPAGKYKILPRLSKSYEFEAREVEVKDRGCAISEFHVKNKTKISGRVLDADGKPVKKIWVEMIPYELTELPGPFSFREDDLTDDAGNFEIENLPPGRYTMSVNYTTSPDIDDRPFPTTFYPSVAEKSEALMFDIRLGGDDITGIEFRLPPRLAAQEIKGVVVWSDDTPASDVQVGLRDAADDLFADDIRTDKDGNFTLKGIKGRKYYISADNYSSENAAQTSYYSSDVFTLDETAKPIRIVLEKKIKALIYLTQE